MTDEKKMNYTFLKDSDDEMKVSEIDFDGLISLGKKKLSIDADEAGYEEDKNSIVFYCTDCKGVVDVERLPPTKRKKVQFKCTQCGEKNVFYGTKRGVESYFHLSSSGS